MKQLSRSNLLRPLLALMTSSLLTGCGEQNTATLPANGSEQAKVTDHPYAGLFQSACASCHGPNATGNIQPGAPSLLGLQDWYIQRQLTHFRDGIRGNIADDTSGTLMAQSASALTNDDIVGLTDYLAQIPPENARASLADKPSNANLARGKDYHLNLCSACHGSDGRGNKALQAPALTGLDSDYVVAQYQKFRAGTRGAHPDDHFGAQMSRLAPAITDDAIVRDIAAYLASPTVDAN